LCVANCTWHTSKLEVIKDDSKEFKTKVSAALQRRWGLKYLDPSEIPVLANAVDPRLRNLKFLSDELKGNVRLEITRLMKQLMDSAALVHIPLVQSPHKKKTALDILLGEEGDNDYCDDCEETVFHGESGSQEYESFAMVEDE